MKLLQDILILDFSQFLSGPSASLRLADLGARVIKIENPNGGDLCRRHYVSNVIMQEESSLFHAINRNKESYAIDLKDLQNRKKINRLIEHADVLMHNFRPGVMQKLALDYEKVKKINTNIIYAEISGYGKQGAWKDKPGQDLLLQAISGLTYLSGNADTGPIPMGLAVADIVAGAHLVQGILACLFRRNLHNIGGLVEVSMLESIIEFQFESITTYFQDGGLPTIRTQSNNAHAYLGAPYGIYQTADGYLALAMGSIPQIGQLLNCAELEVFETEAEWFTHRDEIKDILARHLKRGKSREWLAMLEPADIWCADVLTWDRLFDTEAFRILEMVQQVSRGNGFSYETTRCPISINDEFLRSLVGSPQLGEHNPAIDKELNLNP